MKYHGAEAFVSKNGIARELRDLQLLYIIHQADDVCMQRTGTLALKAQKENKSFER